MFICLFLENGSKRAIVYPKGTLEGDQVIAGNQVTGFAAAPLQGSVATAEVSK